RPRGRPGRAGAPRALRAAPRDPERSRALPPARRGAARARLRRARARPRAPRRPVGPAPRRRRGRRRGHHHPAAGPPPRPGRRRCGVAGAPPPPPPMAPLLVGAVAIVAEQGGLLGHGAALARELGIPCVVGCVGALTLSDGNEVWIDAEAGVVIRLGRG